MEQNQIADATHHSLTALCIYRDDLNHIIEHIKNNNLMIRLYAENSFFNNIEEVLARYGGETHFLTIEGIEKENNDKMVCVKLGRPSIKLLECENVSIDVSSGYPGLFDDLIRVIGKRTPIIFRNTLYLFIIISFLITLSVLLWAFHFNSFFAVAALSLYFSIFIWRNYMWRNFSIYLDKNYKDMTFLDKNMDRIFLMIPLLFIGLLIYKFLCVSYNW